MKDTPIQQRYPGVNWRVEGALIRDKGRKRWGIGKEGGKIGEGKGVKRLGRDKEREGDGE